MKHTDFFKLLSFRERFRYLIGAVLSKVFQFVDYDYFRDFRILLNGIERLGFQLITTEIRNKKLLLRKSDQVIELRINSSDLKVFQQVFIGQGYQAVIDLIKMNEIKIDTIIDAGSNIGLTTLTLFQSFPNSRFICLEPDPQNFEQMVVNLKSISNANLSRQALWYQEELLFINSDFRDGANWSKSVSDRKTESSVEGISLNSLIYKFKLTSVDLLKIDIEGAEAEIFKRGDLSFLDKTKVVAIEIHDEFNCRLQIYKILLERGFLIFNTGELTIGINKKFLLK